MMETLSAFAQSSMLAQTGSAMLVQAGGGGGGGTPPQQNPMGLMIGMVLFVGVFFFFSSRTQKKERQKKADLLAGIKKNDRVMTIGGVLGTVVNVKENEVVLKIDEGTNTRMTVIKRSVQRIILSDDDLTAEAG